MAISEGFVPKRKKDDRLPLGQYETRDFPVLTFGPTQYIKKEEWKLDITSKPRDLVKKHTSLNWNDINNLPKISTKADIHCVTKWSKFDTKWEGVSIDKVLKIVEGDMGKITHLIAHSVDGYTTNLPIDDVINGKGLIAFYYDDREIPSEHGGPVRLIVPHLYFWKSAKWLSKIVFTNHDEPGFWETRGYHNRGDPWKEERYS